MYREILEPIIRSPEFPVLLKELKVVWENEQLRRKEFYDWVTPDMKAEFIDGEIIVHSPVRSKHNLVLTSISRLISTFVDTHDIGYIGVEKVMCRFPRNDYEPDLVYFNKKTADNFSDEQTIFPIPNLIIEILSNSTENRDRGIKFTDFESNGVEEYWIVDAYKDRVEQYLLEDGQYILKGKLTDKDTIKSTIIKNFEAPVAAFFDKKANLEALRGQ